MQRKFKVTTSITKYMWASSRKDAEKFQEELIRKGQIDIFRHGETDVKYCFTGGKDFIEAPEDISKTRNPIEEPRRGDWLEIEHGDVKACALVRRLTRRKVYYFEALSRTERSVDRDRWQLWASQHTIHPSYDGVVPPFIVDEVVNSHEERGMLSGFSATPDSSLILEILDIFEIVEIFEILKILKILEILEVLEILEIFEILEILEILEIREILEILEDL